jgi:tetratricopeptide (TPR) repeat protein
MMKKQIFIILFLGSLFVSAQSVELANNYFDRGEFDKAISIYEEILQKAPNNYKVYQKIVESYQQLKQYDKSEKIIFERLNQSKNPTLNIELGYNFQLQKNTLKANEQYNLAIEQVAVQSNYAYSVAAAFEKKSLIDWAIKSYEVGVLGNPNLNFDYQIALLQGQNGNLELMVDKLLDYSFTNQNNVVLVQNQLTRFMTDTADETFSDYIRKALLIRVQKSQDIFWNQFLSWYFVQQKEYGKAFLQ